MNHALKLVVALALVAALAGLAVFLWLKPAPSSLALEPEKPAEKALEAPGNAAVDSQDGLAAETSSSERASMPKDAKIAPAAGKAAASAEEEVEVVAHIVDEQLRPIVNAWLRTEDESLYASKSKREAAGKESSTRAPQEARAGSDGMARLHWKGRIQGYSMRFVAGADGYGSVFPRGIPKTGETLHLGDLTLLRGGSVSGRVVDKDQRPVAGAEVVVSDEHAVFGSNDVEQLRSRGPSTWLGAPRSKSRDDGSFLVEGVVAGMTRAWARSEGTRWAVSEPLELLAGNELRDVVLVIENEDKADPELRDIEGIVVGPDEKPISKARMQVRQELEGSSWSGGVNAEEDGRFRVHPRERGVKITIDFSDAEERYGHARLEDIKPGTKDLVVRLEEAKVLVLDVRDEHGPVEKYRVRWGHEEWDRRGFADKDEVHADGRTLLRVPTQAQFWYHIEAAGHMPDKLGPLDGSKPPGELALKLKTIPGIHGRVLAGELPVPGAKVALYEQPQNSEIEMNGFTTLVQTSSEKEATSDSDGRFTLDLARDGYFSVFADATGYARAQYGPLRLEAQKGMQDLVIQLDAGGTLEGKVLMPPGRSAAGVIVGINRGDAKPQTRVVGPDGEFRFERLTAGAWEIQRCEEMFHGPTGTSMSSGDDIKARDIRRDFTIAVGQTTRMDLDLRSSEPCVLEIDLMNNGQPARAWSIVAWPKGKHTYTGSPPSGATDSSGRARLVIDETGECSLTIVPPAEAGSAFKIQADVTLQRGTNNWSRNIETGRVEGTLAGWDPAASVQWRLKHSGSVHDYCYLRPDSSGHFMDPFVGAGNVDVLRSGGTPESRNWDTVRSFALGPGESKTLQLP